VKRHELDCGGRQLLAPFGLLWFTLHFHDYDSPVASAMSAKCRISEMDLSDLGRLQRARNRLCEKWQLWAAKRTSAGELASTSIL